MTKIITSLNQTKSDSQSYKKNLIALQKHVLIKNILNTAISRLEQESTAWYGIEFWLKTSLKKTC